MLPFWSGTTADTRPGRGPGIRWLALALIPVLLAACGGGAVRAPVGERAAVPRSGAAQGVHVVRRGESLFSIAWQYGLDYRTLARWNGIRPPYTIHPGQRLRLRPGPVARQRSAPPARPRQMPVPKKAASGSGKAEVARKPSPRTADAPERSGQRVVRWTWPADGPILRRFDPRRPGKKGISIGGRPGDPVRAAADGRVVYSGSGLVGYGRLIIIKHNNLYLSAYGHNRKLLVREGDVVRRGQVIARLGSSGTNRPQLHFEIRRQGRPVDPLRYLPRRR